MVSPPQFVVAPYGMPLLIKTDFLRHGCGKWEYFYRKSKFSGMHPDCRRFCPYRFFPSGETSRANSSGVAPW